MHGRVPAAVGRGVRWLARPLLGAVQREGEATREHAALGAAAGEARLNETRRDLLAALDVSRAALHADLESTRQHLGAVLQELHPLLHGEVRDGLDQLARRATAQADEAADATEAVLRSLDDLRGRPRPPAAWRSAAVAAWLARRLTAAGPGAPVAVHGTAGDALRGLAESGVTLVPADGLEAAPAAALVWHVPADPLDADALRRAALRLAPGAPVLVVAPADEVARGGLGGLAVGEQVVLGAGSLDALALVAARLP